MLDGPLVLVCGSRDWTDRHAILGAILDRAPGKIIHGAAPGADRIAADVARLYLIEAQAFPADWTKHGKRAGILRNLAMLGAVEDEWHEGREVLVLAFQRNGSRGTQHTIDEARRRGIPVEVYARP